MEAMTVDEHGTKLSYIDTGSPRKGSYVTFFAIHGLVFTSPIFEKLAVLARENGMRFVSINRRDYPGSTPLDPGDVETLVSGTDQDRTDFIRARGLEISTFIAKFAALNALPPYSEDTRNGGFVVLGWSLGAAFAHSAVATVHMLPAQSRQQFGGGMRALIMLDPPAVSFGTPSPLPSKTWSPLYDQTIPTELRTSLFSHWITSYFKHGDIASHDLDALTYVVPTTSRMPSIYGMSEKQLSNMTCEAPALGSETPLMVFCGAALNACYKKASFDQEVRSSLPFMKVWLLAAEEGPSFCFPAFWDLEKDDKANGGGYIHFKIVPGANHFVHWDEPVSTYELLQSLL